MSEPPPQPPVPPQPEASAGMADRAEIGTHNQLPVTFDQLSDEHRQMVRDAMAEYQKQCMLAFRHSRHDPPSLSGKLPPVRQVQISEGSGNFQDQIDSAVGHSLINQSPTLKNLVSNSIADALKEFIPMLPGYKGPVHSVASTKATEPNNGKNVATETEGSGAPAYVHRNHTYPEIGTPPNYPASTTAPPATRHRRRRTPTMSLPMAIVLSICMGCQLGGQQCHISDSSSH